MMTTLLPSMTLRAAGEAVAGATVVEMPVEAVTLMSIEALAPPSCEVAVMVASPQLAEKSELSRQSLSTIKNRGTCSALTAVKIATALGVPVTDIVDEAS